MGAGCSIFNDTSETVMNDEETSQFWERFDEHVRQQKSQTSDFQHQRIVDTEKTIVENDDMKKMFEKHHTYAEGLRTKGITELIGEIQPRWRKRNGNLSDKEGELMCVAMMEYRLRGCDMEYFTSGFGSCG